MYNKAYYHAEKQNDIWLITNDLGNYHFLSQDEYDRFIRDELSSDESLYLDLQDKGFLYTNKEHFIAVNSPRLEQMKSCLLDGTRLFIFVLTDACNQCCIYCQAGTAHHSQMSLETCKKGIDMAVQAPVSHLTIEFQGGEPTANPEILKKAVSYAKEVFYKHGKTVDFSVVTNLTDPDTTLLQFFIDEDISISTSLDGPAGLHDYNRPLAVLKSSYAAWNKGLALLQELYKRADKPMQLGALQTTTRESMKYPQEIVDEYINHGFDTIYIRPLTPLGRAKTQWDRIGYTAEEFLSFYREALAYMIELCRQGTYVREITASLYLQRILCRESVGHTEFRSPCGAGIGQMAINYNGKVYTCDEGRMMANMGDELFCLGTVDNTYKELIKSPVVHAVCTASCVEALPFCSDCVYNPYCSACPVVSYGMESDLISHDEESYKCKIAKGILSYLFDILRDGAADTIEILESWI